jgi:hypothetical protein
MFHKLWATWAILSGVANLLVIGRPRVAMKRTRVGHEATRITGDRRATRAPRYPPPGRNPRMRASLLLLPLAVLGLAGCVDVHEHPTPRETVVTPAPQPPATVYTTPGTTATVVTH